MGAGLNFKVSDLLILMLGAGSQTNANVPHPKTEMLDLALGSD